MLNKFLEWQKSNGLKDSTIRNYEMYLNPMNKFKSFEEWTNDTAIQYILEIQKINKPSTVEASKIIMKVFFKWMKKPEVVADIKIKNIKNNLKRDDILTIEDVNKLIASTDSYLYKALIALLFESGARIGEILNLKVKDLQETDRGMIISIPQTKTGIDQRRIMGIFSAQYIRNHITYTALDKENNLFKLSEPAVWRKLGKIAKHAGIEKPVSAHKFRHAQATDMVLRGYQESIIRKKMGWTGDSKMIARYQHIADDDVIDASLLMSGTVPEHKHLANIDISESIKITDASMQLSKISTENETLKAEIQNIHEENLAQKYQDEEERKAMENRFADKMSGMEKMIEKFMKTQKV